MTDQTFSSDTLFLRANDVVTAPLGEELALMRLNSNAYYSLDDIGRRIWELLEQPRSMADMVQILTQRYAVAPTQCIQDISRFLADLQKEGLITISSVADKP